MRSHQPRIGLVTLDLRLASKIRRLIKEYNAELIHVADPRELPLDVRVVIGKRAEGLLKDEKAFYVEDFCSIEELVEKAYETAIVGSGYKTVLVAIDPGKNLGVAYFIDNKLVKTGRYGLLDELAEEVRKFIKRHEDAERKYIIVGAATDFKAVKEALHKLEKKLRGEEVTIMVCDESFTSKGLLPKIKGMSKDEYSALILSLKNLLKLE